MENTYAETLSLPKTPFPMKANLPVREVELLKHWEKIGLDGRVKDLGRERELFVLHDGPPYANGHFHIGHALNKILKDIVNRSQQMLGKATNFVPGWDCHGLPIEWKIEEMYREQHKSKDSVSVLDFREECRRFAKKWVLIQRQEAIRLGLLGDWEGYYTTMEFQNEAKIVAELGKFLMSGALYKGVKPVLWSVVEKTALAEAEVEYYDRVSDSVYVRFPIVIGSQDTALQGASVVIWTTTSWTLPGNRAVAFSPEIEYVLVEVAEVGNDSSAVLGERILLARMLVERVADECKFKPKMLNFAGSSEDLFRNVICAHPFRGKGYDFDVPLLPANFVTTEQGTGFVHIAPGHGEDDFEVCRVNGIEVPQTVDSDGSYYRHVPLFGAKQIFEVGPSMLDSLKSAGALLGAGKVTHSYPHSWRSKAPLIFRTTPQWFISMEINDLRKKALEAIEHTKWHPNISINRIRSMVATRPDWCISRQRAWGVPITVFVHKETGEVLRDPDVFARIVTAITKQGCDAWYTISAQEFLGPKYDAANYDQVFDVLDVWFESGCTHAFVLEDRKDLKWPADLYLEGSDMHRGFFQLTLLESCGTRGRAPFDAVLTHGFVLDEQGRKMSKSLGNVVAPQTVVDKYGAEILRLWVVFSDYFADVRIGDNILKQLSELYRKIRNTLRFILGNLGESCDAVPFAQLPMLERWVLHRLWELDKSVKAGYAEYRFRDVFTELHQFCAVDLSAFYFDIRKDSLYCDGASEERRRACVTVLEEVFSHLITWLSPIMCFTAEEAWLTRSKNANNDSVHLCSFPPVADHWHDPTLAMRIKSIQDARSVVLGAIELERAKKAVGSGLETHPFVYVDATRYEAVRGVDLEEFCITSALTVMDNNSRGGAFQMESIPGVSVTVAKATGKKCLRCWRIRPEVGNSTKHPDLCNRCEAVVTKRANATS